MAAIRLNMGTLPAEPGCMQADCLSSRVTCAISVVRQTRYPGDRRAGRMVETPNSTGQGMTLAAVPEYTEWLASSLSRYEALARRLVHHRAEKGRIIEGVVKSALRGILPGRF